ncbi:carboxylesterase/lipase family protein [Novosphingobium mangrovi (ex Hu et al. 2023)]|uniref:Carboxylic ester hydrolase n=1 Tax=Novosphingobium mangrovi (ex Hu et al. 2023) TaxID=2930094 RepID=A0ABT0AEJ9_9SPHN|nr:carboxylesterase family protein [Novosphingobium mangrovi (ex Hu et al. 2023)]MCJ1961604.1 carboxylesterase family protein [Novosphingobium mangrovi (ex Hu et al. 2023)]
MRPTRAFAARLIGTLVGMGALGAPAAQAQERPLPQVRVEQGALSGVSQGKVEAFLGIPYAAPPVGERRWKAPAPASAWDNVRAADAFGASCIQPEGQGDYGPWTREYVVTDNFSEDCLTLNVWRPSVQATGSSDETTAKALPVMVWIHGGAFTSGSSAVPIYNGHNLATRGMLVVTLNYRLGALGFLATEGRNGLSGNFGVLDQIAALAWVKRNIAAFGGNPDKVTIVGQSAGGMSVHTLLSAPAARGLFHQAIVESGLPAPGMARPIADARTNGSAFLAGLGVSSVAQARQLPAQKLLPAPGGAPLRFGPVVDGKVLPHDPGTSEGIAALADVPMIVGMNQDENVTRRPVAPALSQDEWHEEFETNFPNASPDLAALYAATSDTGRAAAARRMRWQRGLGAHLVWARERHAHARSPFYTYFFTHAEPPARDAREAALWGAFHSSEIPYLFGTLGTSAARDFGFDDWRVALTMSDLWASFITRGTPTSTLAPRWPTFDPADPRLLVIEASSHTEPFMDEKTRQILLDYAQGTGTLSMF